ncbi:MAG: preprotein translocase subunit YajC [Planctomycetes bacterium]|nr:preprotein translocase subunit YajC [Planctomycetota bacterium]
MTVPSGPAWLGLLQDTPPEQPNWMFLLLGVVAIFVFVAVLPERKERKRREAMMSELKKNDRVVLHSGFLATVAAVSETEITIRFDDGNTRAKVLRSAIANVLDRDGAEA